MAGELALLKAVLDLVGAERVLKNVQKAWVKSRWARDASRVNAVERKIDTLSHEVARLARHLTLDSIPSEVKRTLERFERDLEELGLTKEEAKELRVSVAEQLDSSVLEPIAEARRLQNRMETLEAEALDATKRIVALEPLAARTLEAEKRAAASQTIASVALAASALSLIATILLAIIRR